MKFINNSIRVRYGETDQMGFVYHANYIQYLEVARVELFRSIGLSYKEIEEKGIQLPVENLSIEYKQAALYDDELTIHTIINELPMGVRVHFTYEIYNQNNQLIATAKTSLFSINLYTKKVTKFPEFILEKLKPYFE
jgi:acyl-CoA thioester hydrolase